ncbi:hypothetical protein N7540_007771 [Penicillium herquei]|nr:hypothetical protein N7540_007771 [Penicillium herquei]
MDREKEQLEPDRDALKIALSFNLPEEILNARSSSGHTALHTALLSEKLRPLASTLITCGIDIDLTIGIGLELLHGAMALHIALKRREWDLARDIIKAGCQLNVIVLYFGMSNWNELNTAIMENAPVDIISSLLTGGADINRIRDCRFEIHSATFQPILSWAIEKGDEDGVRTMLDMGINPPDLTILSQDGETPIQQARNIGNVMKDRMCYCVVCRRQGESDISTWSQQIELT